MTAMRDHLAAELARKVSQKGLVVWQDSEREYVDVAESLCPPGARFVAYEGSWYALRRAVEPFLAGDAPPKMVIYASARAPEEDPLEELRAAGRCVHPPAVHAGEGCPGGSAQRAAGGRDRQQSPHFAGSGGSYCR